MKTINHNYANNNVCIYSIKDGVMIGSFFKEKPEVEDIIHVRYLDKTFQVVEILSNKDAIISDTCTKKS